MCDHDSVWSTAIRKPAYLKKLAEVFHTTGKWNTYEIQCLGETLSVKLNGALITKAHNIKHLRGHIGIQGEHGRVEFRNLRVKLLDE